jgi:outer membrane protein TolC
LYFFLIDGKHWPELRLNGTIGRTGFKKSDLTDSSANLWTAGLQLNVPIFSGLSYFFEKGSLQSQSLQLKYQEQELRNQLSSNQVKFLQDLRSSESVITYSKAAYELADQSVKEAKRQYKLAAIDYVQFLTTEQKMIDSELALDQARFEYLSLLTKYFRAYGYPPEVLVDSLGS